MAVAARRLEQRRIEVFHRLDFESEKVQVYQPLMVGSVSVNHMYVCEGAESLKLTFQR